MGRGTAFLTIVTLSVNWAVALGAQVSQPLQPLWSLTIEEQFYLLWPAFLIAVFLLHRNSDRAKRVCLGAAIAIAIASAAESVALWFASHDQTRVYFGSDTRVQGLMIGAALAIWLSMHPRISVGVARPVAIAGVALIAATSVLVADTNPLRVAGGLTAAAVATAAIICYLVLVPRSRLATILSFRPLTWAGRRSYAIYLWNGMVLMYTNLYGWKGWVLGLALTAACAEVSWVLVERPEPTVALKAPRFLSWPRRAELRS
jgi:peptidoglycan/LPS O-acetylase OafA/YrhL